MKLKLFVSYFAVACLTLALNTSCQKKTDCKLTIKTVDAAGFPVAGAAVKLYANVKTSSGATVEADLKTEGVSDSGGSSSYTFKLPAILDVKAVATTGTVSISAVAIVKLEEGKTVEKTLTLK